MVCLLKETVYNKLIRDKIPQIIRNDGKEPIIREIKDNEEFLQLLIDKLQEEVHEFQASRNPEELADIMEVILTISHELEISITDINSIQEDKRVRRGGFTKKLFLIKVKE